MVAQSKHPYSIAEAAAIRRQINRDMVRAGATAINHRQLASTARAARLAIMTLEQETDALAWALIVEGADLTNTGGTTIIDMRDYGSIALCSDAPVDVPRLRPRRIEILDLIALEATPDEMAAVIHTSRKTIYNYVFESYRILGIDVDASGIERAHGPYAEQARTVWALWCTTLGRTIDPRTATRLQVARDDSAARMRDRPLWQAIEPRERAVLDLGLRGLQLSEIARTLGLNRGTLKSRMSRQYRRLGYAGFDDLVRGYALSHVVMWAAWRRRLHARRLLRLRALWVVMREMGDGEDS